MAGMSQLIEKIERLAAGEVMTKIAQKVRDAAHAECIAGFAQQRDPYGVPWAPRKTNPGKWPLLDKTGTGVNSLTSRAVGSSVKMRIVGYMKFHQYGTSNMDRRMIFPDPARGLGAWRDPVIRASTEAVRELMLR